MNFLTGSAAALAKLYKTRQRRRVACASRPSPLVDRPEGADHSTCTASGAQRRRRRQLLNVVALMTGLGWTCLVFAQSTSPHPDFGHDTADQVHVFVPSVAAFDPAMVGKLRPSVGYRVTLVASDMGNVRVFARAPDGTIYVSRNGQGEIAAFRLGADGRANDVRTVLKAPGAHGLAVRDGKLYVATVGEILVADLGADGSLGSTRTLLTTLPDAGQHGRRTIGFAPDGRLFLSVGSSCNACLQRGSGHAAMHVADADGKNRRIFAEGLRNTMAWAFEPGTGRLFGVDNGSDFQGNDFPGEEINLIEDGGDYGWPFCAGPAVPDRGFSYSPGGSANNAEFCKTTRKPVFELEPHGAPIQLIFLPGGDALVSLHGSWNRKPLSGYKVVRVHFAKGLPVASEDFLTGFLGSDGRIVGRPAALLALPDGSVLVGDDTNGAIYRVEKAR